MSNLKSLIKGSTIGVVRFTIQHLKRRVVLALLGAGKIPDNCSRRQLDKVREYEISDFKQPFFRPNWFQYFTAYVILSTRLILQDGRWRTYQVAHQISFSCRQQERFLPIRQGWRVFGTLMGLVHPAYTRIPHLLMLLGSRKTFSRGVRHNFFFDSLCQHIRSQDGTTDWIRHH